MPQDSSEQIVESFLSVGIQLTVVGYTKDKQLTYLDKWNSRGASSVKELAALVQEFMEARAGYAKTMHMFAVLQAPWYVVDLDVKEDLDIVAKWEAWAKERLGDVPQPALRVKTKSGGYHLYFKHTDKSRLKQIIGKSTAKFIPGIDIKPGGTGVFLPTTLGEWSKGEYAVLPEFVSNGKLTWSSVPAVDYFRLIPKEVMASRFDGATLLRSILQRQTTFEQKVELLKSYIVPHGSRDDTLFSGAGICHQMGLNKSEALTIMTILASRCEISENESHEAYIELAKQKVERRYASEHSALIATPGDFYAELNHVAKVVRISGSEGTTYVAQEWSDVLAMVPELEYSSIGLSQKLSNLVVGVSDKGKPVTADKVLYQWVPKYTAHIAKMIPAPNKFIVASDSREVVYNTYKDPWSSEIEPLDGQDSENLIELFTDFVRYVIGNESDASYFLKKMGWLLKNPHRRMITASFIWSDERGIGKDSLIDLWGLMVGKQYFKSVDFESLFHQYSPLSDAILVKISEFEGLKGNDGLKKMSRLKNLITSTSIQVRQPYQPFKTITPFFHPVILANMGPSTIIEDGDRRWDVFHSRHPQLPEGGGRFAPLINLAQIIKISRSPSEYERRMVVTLRKALIDQEMPIELDRTFAIRNEAKEEATEYVGPPELRWLQEPDNLPPVFTEDVVMWSMLELCPYDRAKRNAWAFEQLKALFGQRLRRVKTNVSSSGQTMKIRNAPKLTISKDSIGKAYKDLSFTSENSYAKPVFTFDKSGLYNSASTKEIRHLMQSWYVRKVEEMFTIQAAQNTPVALAAQNGKIIDRDLLDN